MRTISYCDDHDLFIYREQELCRHDPPTSVDPNTSPPIMDPLLDREVAEHLWKTQILVPIIVSSVSQPQENIDSCNGALGISKFNN